MPKVEIGTAYGVTVRVEANEASVEELRKQAMETFKEATEVQKAVPSGPGFGFTGEKRWTPDHEDLGYPRGRGGFGPVHAEGGGS